MLPSIRGISVTPPGHSRYLQLEAAASPGWQSLVGEAEKICEVDELVLTPCRRAWECDSQEQQIQQHSTAKPV